MYEPTHEVEPAVVHCVQLALRALIGARVADIADAQSRYTHGLRPECREVPSERDTVSAVRVGQHEESAGIAREGAVFRAQLERWSGAAGIQRIGDRRAIANGEGTRHGPIRRPVSEEHRAGRRVVAGRQRHRASGVRDREIFQVIGNAGDVARDEGQAQQRLSGRHIDVRRNDLYIYKGNIAARRGRPGGQCDRERRRRTGGAHNQSADREEREEYDRARNRLNDLHSDPYGFRLSRRLACNRSSCDHNIRRKPAPGKTEQ
jgi:hypothetical protein